MRRRVRCLCGFVTERIRGYWLDPQASDHLRGICPKCGRDQWTVIPKRLPGRGKLAQGVQKWL